MKKNVDNKNLLFENMAKLNSNNGFNINEDKNWIQGAVNPEHKGYCTPMSKPTCTPQRKALARRFKKGIENESVNLNSFDNPDFYRDKAEKIKNVIDKLINDGDFDVVDGLYRLVVGKKKELDNRPNPNNITEDHSPEYRRKAELLKGKIDFLFNSNHYDIIDKLESVLNKLYNVAQPEPEFSDALNEAVKKMKHLIF